MEALIAAHVQAARESRGSVLSRRIIRVRVTRARANRGSRRP